MTKGSRCLGLTTLPRSCTDFIGILGNLSSWNLQCLSSSVQGMFLQKTQIKVCYSYIFNRSYKLQVTSYNLQPKSVWNVQNMCQAWINMVGFLSDTEVNKHVSSTTIFFFLFLIQTCNFVPYLSLYLNKIDFGFPHLFFFQKNTSVLRNP